MAPAAAAAAGDAAAVSDSDPARQLSDRRAAATERPGVRRLQLLRGPHSVASATIGIVAGMGQRAGTADAWTGSPPGAADSHRRWLDLLDAGYAGVSAHFDLAPGARAGVDRRGRRQRVHRLRARND